MSDLSGCEIGRYHLLEKLGEGGMAVVYKAFDTRLECEVAVKFIRMDRITPESVPIILKRFATEARKTASLTHPNIVPVTDYGEYEGNPYLVMKYLPGGTLKQMAGNPMDWQQALSLILPIAEALDYAHKNGIIHRDVKPGNILITASGVPMLSDFGIARVIDAQEETLDHLTATGVGIGTPEYMAPEQALGRKVDGRADIYALGVVLYELVTGRKPFTADTPLAVILKQANDPLPRPVQFVVVPEALEHLLFKALAKKPEDRFEDMQAFILQVHELIKGEHESKDKQLAEKENIDSDHRQQPRNNWLWFGVVITIIALLVIFNRQIFTGANRATSRPPITSYSTETAQVSSSSTQKTESLVPNVDASVLFSDEFLESGFDGSYNQQKWSCPDGNCQSEYARQENGSLLLVNNSTRPGTAHTLEAKEFWKSSEVAAVEADVMVAEFSGESTSEIILQLNVQSGDFDWYTSCNTGGDEIGGYFNCRVRTKGIDDYLSKLIRINIGQWYKVRIELDDKTMAMNYYLDNEKIGSFIPENADKIANSDMRVTLASYSNGKNEFSGYVDNFSIFTPGEKITDSKDQLQVEGVMLAVEDFDDQKVNMVGYSASDNCSIVQDVAGNYVYQIDNRNFHDYEGFAIGDDENSWKNYSVEFRIKFLGQNEESCTQIRTNGYIFDIICISPDYVYLADKNWNRSTTKIPPISVGEWTNVQIDVFHDAILVYIDGSLWIEGLTSSSNGGVSFFASGDNILYIDDIWIYTPRFTN